MSHQQEDFKPNWENIVYLSDELDKVIEKGIVDKEMSFLELDISLLLVTEKLNQEKHKAMNHLLSEEESEHIAKPKDIYK